LTLAVNLGWGPRCNLLKLVRMGDRKGSPLLYDEAAWQARV